MSLTHQTFIYLPIFSYYLVIIIKYILIGLPSYNKINMLDAKDLTVGAELIGLHQKDYTIVILEVQPEEPDGSKGDWRFKVRLIHKQVHWMTSERYLCNNFRLSVRDEFNRDLRLLINE